MVQKFEIKLRKRNNPAEELLEDLRNVAREIDGAALTAAIYSERGKFGVNTMRRRFGSWNAALEQAGIRLNNILNVPNEALFENLASVWQRIGRQPVGKDLDKSSGASKFSLGTYEKRFGSWNNALLAFSDFINGEAETAIEVSAVPILEQSSRPRTPRKINWRLRASILIRDNCICQMCGASPSKNQSVLLHVDHVVPWSKGGETLSENLRTLCSVCNIGKSDQVIS